MEDLLKKRTIGTISEYTDLIFIIFKQWEAEKGDEFLPPQLWFRGQDRDDPLLPKVLRKVKDPNTGKECSYNEAYILQSFSASYQNYTSERFQEKSSEYYSFMQHYGIPTRLLDWTENGILALYFAVNGGMYDDDVQRVVWVMNPGAINRLTTGREGSYAPLLSTVPFVQARMRMSGYVINGNLIPAFKKRESDFDILSDEQLKFPVAFWPTSSGNLRIAAQKGCFTVHGTDPQPIESVFDDHEIQKYLIKVEIRKESVTSLREQLQLMGETPMSVYPDLFGLTTELSGPRYMKETS